MYQRYGGAERPDPDGNRLSDTHPVTDTHPIPDSHTDTGHDADAHRHVEQRDPNSVADADRSAEVLLPL
ncbi:hypothetical protein [Enemella evansiae]|uniref:hypothetical protein n=1 Tax=Enemella evansiae TaxID=2016499 RepID=UPI0015951826|nr:hypothetical protein [Enemella evansiae]